MFADSEENRPVLSKGCERQTAMLYVHTRIRNVKDSHDYPARRRNNDKSHEYGIS